LEFRCVARAEGRRLRHHWRPYEHSPKRSLFKDRRSNNNNASGIIGTASWGQNPGLIAQLPILRFGVRCSSRFLDLYSNISRREEIKGDGSCCTYVEHKSRNATWETMYFTYAPVCAVNNTLFNEVDLAIVGSGNMIIHEGLQAADIQHSAWHDFYYDSARIKLLSLSQ